MASDKIKFTEIEKEMIKNEAVNAMVSELQTTVDWQSLWNSANDFMNAVKSTQIHRQELELRQLVTKIQDLEKISEDQFTPSTAAELQKNMQLLNSRKEKLQEDLKVVYQQLFIFDNAQAAFRGQIPKLMAYIHTPKDSGVPRIYTFPMEKILDYTYITNEGKLSFNLRVQDLEAITGSRLGYASKQAEAKNKSALYAFTGSYSRLEQFYKIRKGIHYKKQEHKKKEDKTRHYKTGGILLWKEGEDWTKGWVLNYGVLKEGYMGALLGTKGRSLPESRNNPPYQNHGLIGAFFRKFVTDVGNKGAIIEEDIVGKEFQYAVKSSNASLPEINQFEQMAQAILKSQHELNPESLKATIAQKSEGALAKIIKDEEQDLDSETEEALSYLFKDSSLYKNQKK